MTYWVYENWTQKKAIIHRGECSYCQNGAGIHCDTGKRNGEWHGPYENQDSAFQKGEGTNRDVVRACKVCAP